MNFNFEKWNLDFVKHRKKYFAFSLSIVVIGVILLLTMGLNLGIDFESGSRVEVLAPDAAPLTEEEVRAQFQAINYEPDDITLAGDNFEMAHARFIGVLEQPEIIEIQAHFAEQYGVEPSVSTVSPQVGQELARNALISVLIASIGIIIYLAIRFEWLYGLAAVIALLYDAFVIIAVFCLLQIEINVSFIAAVLTVIGYSLNDTIVTFDRIRENMKFAKRLKTFDDLADVVNKSLVQTLTRSINLVVTVLFAAVSIFIFGGEAIRSFAFALIVGLTAGAYSSLFLAAQLWLVWKHKQMKRKKQKSLESADQIG